MVSAGNADPSDVPLGRGLVRSGLRDAALAALAYRLSFFTGPSNTAGWPGLV